MDGGSSERDGGERPPEPARPAAERSGGRPPGSGQGRGQTRGGDETRRRRPTERRAAGFGDEIERAACAASPHRPPPGFPVQHRTGCATLRRLVVARRPGALLLCDSGHPGPHRWPDGTPVLDDDAGGSATGPTGGATVDA